MSLLNVPVLIFMSFTCQHSGQLHPAKAIHIHLDVDF